MMVSTWRALIPQPPAPTSVPKESPARKNSAPTTQIGAGINTPYLNCRLGPATTEGTPDKTRRPFPSCPSVDLGPIVTPSNQKTGRRGPCTTNEDSTPLPPTPPPPNSHLANRDGRPRIATLSNPQSWAGRKRQSKVCLAVWLEASIVPFAPFSSEKYSKSAKVVFRGSWRSVLLSKMGLTIPD